MLVRLCNSGIQNPLAVYSSDGMTLDLGNAQDSDLLHKLWLQVDEFQGQQKGLKQNNVATCFVKSFGFKNNTGIQLLISISMQQATLLQSQT